MIIDSKNKNIFCINQENVQFFSWIKYFYVQINVIISCRKQKRPLPTVGKDQMNWRRACPKWGRANPFYFLQTHDGQWQICFTSCFPKMGKVESILLLASPNWAKANQFHFLSAHDGQGRIFLCLPKPGRSVAKRRVFLDFIP